jgi:hypothetical protein
LSFVQLRIAPQPSTVAKRRAGDVRANCTRRSELPAGARAYRLARTRDWLRYEVPDRYVRRDARGFYKGQKQIWSLLQMVVPDHHLNLRATDHPEFDAWRWNDYWCRSMWWWSSNAGVYEMALTELSRLLATL